MRRFLLLFLFLALVVINAHGQRYAVRGWVQDSFTHDNLDSARVTFMTLDSVTVKTIPFTQASDRWQINDSLPKAGDYLIKVEKVGYETTWRKERFKYIPYRNIESEMEPFYLTKIRQVNLSEVVVKATKVKMVMHGDTIVYNADAFNLREGSMLDKLISMLPGTTISREGVISVNGRPVSSLLVNGNDFFKGDPTIALKNLPAYMVDKVKVYEKMSYTDEALGYTREEKVGQMPFVMDVRLKRQYEIGWLANVSLGGGTDNHYAARAFVMRYSKHSRVALYGNMSDISGDAYYDSQGAWQNNGGNLSTGLIRSAQAGLNLNVEDREKKWKVDGCSVFKNRRNIDDGSSSTVNFLQGGNVFSRELHRNVARQTSSRSQMSVEMSPKKGRAFNVSSAVNYSYQKNVGRSLSADYDVQLAERYRGEALDSLFSPFSSARWRQNLIESLRSQTLGQGHSLDANLNLQGHQRFNMDQLNFNFGASYDNSRNRSLSHYADYQGSQLRDRFSDYDAKGYRVNGFLDYNINFAGLWGFDRICLSPDYGFDYEYRSSHNPYYILDGSMAADWDLDLLASSKDSLQQQIDFNNSYYSSTWSTTHRFVLRPGLLDWSHGRGNISLFIELPLRYSIDKADYQRGSLDTVARKNYLFFEPKLDFYYQKYGAEVNKQLNVHFSSTRRSPGIIQQLNFRDDATPLVVRLGNPNLQAPRDWKAEIGVQRSQNKTNRSWNARIYYRLTEHQLCQRMTYDKLTGIRTYRPDNINGNWNIGINGGFGLPLDKKKIWWFHSNTSFNYTNSADYASLDGSSSSRSSVRRTMAGQQLQVDYRLSDYNFGVSTSVNWNHSESNLYQTMNLWETYTRFHAGLNLPWHWQFNTSLSVYGHHGYQDDSYNNTEMIWNASLSKSFFHSRLLFTLDAFDILDQIRSTSYVINAQMQKESYRNTLHRYVMLHVAYRLEVKPKKAK